MSAKFKSRKECQPRNTTVCPLHCLEAKVARPLKWASPSGTLQIDEICIALTAYSTYRKNELSCMKNISETRGKFSYEKVRWSLKLIFHIAQWEEFFSQNFCDHCYYFLAEMGRIPCCGRHESYSSNI